MELEEEEVNQEQKNNDPNLKTLSKTYTHFQNLQSFIPQNQVSTTQNHQYFLTLTNLNTEQERQQIQTKHQLTKRMNSQRAKRKARNFLLIPRNNYDIPRPIIYRDMISLAGGIDAYINEDITLISHFQNFCLGAPGGRPLQHITLNHIQSRCEQFHTQTIQSTYRFEFLSTLCLRKQSTYYKQLADLLTLYQNKLAHFPLLAKKLQRTSKADLILLEQQYKSFIRSVFNQLDQNYSHTSIYRYCIGRVNYSIGDIEIEYSGCSHSYLHLLGIDFESYKNLLLRGKQIPFKSDKLDMSSFALEAMRIRLMEPANPHSNDPKNQNENHSATHTTAIKSWIQTFDGFEIQITEKVKQVASHFLEFNKHDHIAYIIEIDVDPLQLEELLHHRQRLLYKSKMKTFEEFTQSQFSPSLEDIEYSFKAEQFLEKFYPSYKNVDHSYNQPNHNRI